MSDKNINSYAEYLFDMMGDKAEVYATQQQAAFDRSVESDNSRAMRRDWSRIREAISMMKHSGSRYPRH